ncbi:hypothetical protein BGZ73_005362 [Actinomortierella ambigua]|nr:hypothetical protein BGZ73_005362 [Actinomortierella ambigua]
MSTVYDRRALDCTATLPMISSLTNLAYQTSASPAVREFVSRDGGLERLVAILKKTPMTDRRNGLKWTLAFQCVVNIGVRGTERIRKRVVESGMILVTVKVLESFLEVLKQVREENERNQRMEAAQANNSTNGTSASAPVAPLLSPAPSASVYSTNLPLALRENMTPHSHPSSLSHNSHINHTSSHNIHATLPLPGHYSHSSQASAAMDGESGSHNTASSVGSSNSSGSSRRSSGTAANGFGILGAHASSLGNVSSRSSPSRSPERAQQAPGGTLSASTLSHEPINILGTQTTEEPQSMDTDPRLVPQGQPSLSQQQPQRQSHQFFFREDDILQCLQLLAYLSKYPSLRSAFNDASGPNVFAIVEKFTHRAMHPLEIQYWAGVIMRNFCRKDDSRMGIRQCAYTGCGKWESKPREFAKCRRCRKAKYCSKQCQSKAWSDGHRWWCIERKPESMGVSSMYASDPPPAPPPPPPPAPDLQDQAEQEPALSVNGGILSIGAPTGTRVVGGAGGNLSAIQHARGIRITDTPALQGPAATGPSLHAPTPMAYHAAGTGGHGNHPGQPGQGRPQPHQHHQHQHQQRSDSGYPPTNPSPLNPTTHSAHQQQQQQHQQQRSMTTPSMSAHPQASPHAHSRQPSQQSQQGPQQQVAMPHQQQLPTPARSQVSSGALASPTGGSRPSFPPGVPTPEQLAQHFVCQVAQNPGQHNQLVQQLHEQFRRYYPVEQHAEAKRLFSLHARTYFASFQQMQNAAQAQQQPPRSLPTPIRGDAVFQPNSAPLRPMLDMSSSEGPVSAPVSNLGHLPPYPGEGLPQVNAPLTALGSANTYVSNNGTSNSNNSTGSHSTTDISSGVSRTPDRRRSYEDSDDEYGGPSTRTTSVPMLTQDLSSTTLSSSFASEPMQTSPVEGRFPRISLPGTFGGSGSSSSSAASSSFPSSASTTGANPHDAHAHHHHHQQSWTSDTQMSSGKVARDYKVRKLMRSEEHGGNDGDVSPASVSTHHHQAVGEAAVQVSERSHYENGWSYSRQMAAQESHQHHHRPNHP